MKQIAARLAVPPMGLVLFSIGSVQIGSALAKSLFQQVGPTGMVLLRVGLAAVILFVIWRPRWQGLVRTHLWLLVAFGLSLALMNWSFYEAISRIPIGIGVALEFLGPLGVAIANSRRWVDGLWVLLAAAGILLLAPFQGVEVDPLGVALALLAGGFWAAYILLSARTGRAIAGIDGLAWAMAIATVVLLPVGILGEGAALLQPQALTLGLGVALLSSVIPYSFELVALRSLPVKTFGVLLSLEPVAAAIAGWLILGETLSLRAIVAILLVSLAAAGAACFRA
ncbi:MAG: EamA family transporter [Leptolyngbyaceae cyanobacterium SM1_1_3]|nr:EamA family transporter [Leptolyngbyaceae cyanobacterium SM1_1_3]NJN04665.1 EamA family transporter [Leptolyngbyaceae cyanobacterium RM1_1_2]